MLSPPSSLISRNERKLKWYGAGGSNRARIFHSLVRSIVLVGERAIFIFDQTFLPSFSFFRLVFSIVIVVVVDKKDSRTLTTTLHKIIKRAEMGARASTSTFGVGWRWWHRYALSLSFIRRLMYFKYTVGECVTNRIVCVQHEQVFNIQMSERQRRTKSVTAKKCTDFILFSFIFSSSFIIRFVHFESHRLCVHQCLPRMNDAILATNRKCVDAHVFAAQPKSPLMSYRSFHPNWRMDFEWMALKWKFIFNSTAQMIDKESSINANGFGTFQLFFAF